MSAIDRAVRVPTHHQRLRAATRSAHELVDTRYSQFDLTTRSGYRSFLTAHASVLPALETRLTVSGAAAVLPDWSMRLRGEALADDLASLGIAEPGTKVIALEPLAGPALLGMLYVLEGSRLGGAVLAGRVAQNADPDCRDATRYLRHGERRGLWPSFIAMFDASSVVRDCEAAVIEGALDAFALFAGTGERGVPADGTAA